MSARAPTAAHYLVNGTEQFVDLLYSPERVPGSRRCALDTQPGFVMSRERAKNDLTAIPASDRAPNTTTSALDLLQISPAGLAPSVPVPMSVCALRT